MFAKKETYCRLCAELTPEELLIKSNDNTACNEKMLWFNVDMSATDRLPKTICLSCFDLLEKTCEFLETVRTAQQTLDKIYSQKPIADCKVKVENDNVKAGNPLDKNWEWIEEKPPKSEIETEDDHQNLDNNVSNGASVETQEPSNNDDQVCYDDDKSHGKTYSDQPMSKKENEINESIHYEVEIDPDDFLPNPNAEVIVLDMSSVHCLRYVTWASYTWQCAYCDVQCKSIASLRLHSLETHSCCCGFKCSDCNKVIANHNAFVSHVRIHHNLLLYSCEFCNKQIDTILQLEAHKRLEHEHFTYCRNCGESFNSHEQLFDHALKYAKRLSKPSKKKRKPNNIGLKCKHCGREFSNKTTLRNHIFLHSERSRDFVCHVCGKKLSAKSTLKSHMALHEEARYKCEFCDMAFKSRGGIISHISLHSGTKPFVCEQCGKHFRTKRYLKNHSIVHTDLMPFVCQHCKKAFRLKTHLNLHMRQHTGVKPYMCLDCARDFTNNSNFQKHMRRRHNVDTPKRKTYTIVKHLNSINNNKSRQQNKQ